jgi:hypothetical protein
VIPDVSSRHAWESVIRPLEPLYLTAEAYRACRHARPDFDWSGFESRLEIKIRRDVGGKSVVMILEDTPAAQAIREAL